MYYTVYSTLNCIIFFQISIDYFLYIFLNYGELSSLGHSGECFIHDIQKSSTYVDNVVKDIQRIIEINIKLITYYKSKAITGLVKCKKVTKMVDPQLRKYTNNQAPKHLPVITTNSYNL